MAFEWDEEKRKPNLIKHGVDFRQMSELFDGAIVEVVVSRQDYGETRINCLGEVEGARGEVEGVSTPSPTPGAAPIAGSSARGRPMRENRKHITCVSSDEARRLRDDTDDVRVDAMTDDDIARAVADDPDTVPLDLDWTKARLVIPPGKEVVTLRLDIDVLGWFRAQGKGYQTRINQVLRVWYETELLKREWERERRKKTAPAIQKAAKRRAAKERA
jgi:uncharacterized protein (DUF4415 family)